MLVNFWISSVIHQIRDSRELHFGYHPDSWEVPTAPHTETTAMFDPLLARSFDTKTPVDVLQWPRQLSKLRKPWLHQMDSSKYAK